MNVCYKRKISGVSKQAKFDVRTFKGQYDYNKHGCMLYISKIKIYITVRLYFVRDMILRRKVEVLLDEE